jgi:hypothetical protein
VRVVAAIRAFAALFVTLALGALVVGIHDAGLTDVGLGVTASAAVLFVVAVVLLLGAYELFALSRWKTWPDGKRPPCKPVVLVGFLLLLLLNVYLFFAAFRGTGAQRFVVVLLTASLIVVALIGLRYFGSEARVTLARVGTVALGLIGTTLAAWQFWYSNDIAPSRAGRAVQLSVDLAPAGTKSRDELVRATLSYQAVTGRSVSVIGSAYTLTGVRIVRCDRRERVDARVVAPLFSGFLLDPQRRFMADAPEQQPNTVLAAGKFVGDGRRLEADVPYTRRYIFFVPRGRYQLLRLRAQLFAMPASVQLSRRTVPEFTPGDDNFLYAFWHLDDDSWLHDLVYGRERWAVIRYELATGTGKASSEIRVAARLTAPAWTEGKPSLAQARALFPDTLQSDPSEPFADTELPLDDAADYRRGDNLSPDCANRR